SRRPEIGLPQEAQLTPQTHESGDKVPQNIMMLKEDGAPPQVAGAAGRSGMGCGNGSGYGVMGGVIGGPGSGGNYGGGLRKVGGGVSDSLAVNAAPMMAYEQSAAGSFAANSTAAAFDDYFAYNLSEPITIRKNESALVPILQTKIDAERVTLWSPRQPTPLRALWITNTSNLTLDRGSFSIVEDGNFGGEGLLDPIHPAEKRLLSYAIDQAARVPTESQHETMQATSLTASKGVVILHHTQVAEIPYVVHNA